MMLGAYSWLCAYGSLLAVLRGSYMVPGIDPVQGKNILLVKNLLFTFPA